MKKKVVVFGDLPIATKITKDLISRNDVNLVGVVLSSKKFNNNDPWKNTPCLFEFAKLNKIKILNINDLLTKKIKVDLGFTIRFNKILSSKLIDKFSDGIINFHGGLLPECAGLYSSCHSILLNHKKGGGTLHYLKSNIDGGNIIKRAEFDISDDDTSISLFKRTEIYLLQAYYQVINSIINGTNASIPQQELISKGIKSNYFDKNSLIGKRKIELNSSQDDILRVVRAFDHPDHEKAYIVINGTKVYLSTIKKSKDE